MTVVVRQLEQALLFDGRYDAFRLEPCLDDAGTPRPRHVSSRAVGHLRDDLRTGVAQERAASTALWGRHDEHAQRARRRRLRNRGCLTDCTGDRLGVERIDWLAAHLVGPAARWLTDDLGAGGALADSDCHLAREPLLHRPPVNEHAVRLVDALRRQRTLDEPHTHACSRQLAFERTHGADRGVPRIATPLARRAVDHQPLDLDQNLSVRRAAAHDLSVHSRDVHQVCRSKQQADAAHFGKRVCAAPEPPHHRHRAGRHAQQDQRHALPEPIDEEQRAAANGVTPRRSDRRDGGQDRRGAGRRYQPEQHTEQERARKPAPFGPAHRQKRVQPVDGKLNDPQHVQTKREAHRRRREVRPPPDDDRPADRASGHADRREHGGHHRQDARPEPGHETSEERHRESRRPCDHARSQLVCERLHHLAFDISASSFARISLSVIVPV
ncbi:hypothetical protein emb_1d0674 [Coriobacteriaceae bacterium EMTCatB1]|nr:hypothetical protein emb_1d0674 [Coriobacteriaceae bacterium EMTCatB1]